MPLSADSKEINNIGSKNDDRILVCLSSSPSNPKVIDAAAGMAEAFNAALTAIYVKPADFDSISDINKIRLQSNIKFAEQKGATVITVIGNDVPVQIAEYAHASGANKIVVGQSGAKKRHFWSTTTLTEQIILNAPDADVFIIPDSTADFKKQSQRLIPKGQISPTWKDTAITLLFLALSTGVGLLFTMFGFSDANIITVFILGVLIIAVLTVSPIYCIVSSLTGVLLFNWFFTEPKLSFHTYEPEYLVTFAIMLVSSLITGTLANKLKESARQSAREAFRAKVLFDTNQLLQKAESADDVIKITMRQINALLNRDVVVLPLTQDKELGDAIELDTPKYTDKAAEQDENESDIAKWVFNNQTVAGTHTANYRKAKITQVLINLINNAIKNTQKGSEIKITSENLKIDYPAGCAFLNGEELKLTPIEFKLLCLLARNTGKVLTHTYITQNIWGRSWDNDIASLRVFMVTLRKKLIQYPGSPEYIQTHVGIGYRMIKTE